MTDLQSARAHLDAAVTRAEEGELNDAMVWATISQAYTALASLRTTAPMELVAEDHQWQLNRYVGIRLRFCWCATFVVSFADDHRWFHPGSQTYCQDPTPSVTA